MERYFAGLSRMKISRVKRMSVTASPDVFEILLFRRLAREILWLGCTASPVGCYIASITQQQIPEPKVLYILQTNEAAKKLSNMGPQIEFQILNKIERITGIFSIVTYADMAFNVFASTIYGQTDFVIEIVFPGRDESHEVYHLIVWV